MNINTLRERFRGALMGGAVGDVLGAPFEGRPVVAGADLHGLQDPPRSLRYTDDTHMTMGLCVSLLARAATYDPDHMIAAFRQAYVVEPWRGYGPGTRQVLESVGQGTHWDTAARSLFGGKGSFGNGAAMRVAPVALFAFPDLDATASLARATGRLTHAHEHALEGAMVQAGAVGLLLQWPAEDRITPSGFVSALLAHVSVPLYTARLEQVAELALGTPVGQVVQHLGHGATAYEAVPAALCAFLRQPDSMVETIRFAIRLGEDTDTIAAMAGALSGAWLGESAIPTPWRSLEGVAELATFADQFLIRATRTTTRTTAPLIF